MQARARCSWKCHAALVQKANVTKQGPWAKSFRFMQNQLQLHPIFMRNLSRYRFRWLVVAVVFICMRASKHNVFMEMTRSLGLEWKYRAARITGYKGFLCMQSD